MLNASKMLLLENVIKVDPNKQRFSIKWLASLIIHRQEMGKDTIIIIIGDRRNGKSNWMLRLIQAFIKLKKEIDPNFKWAWKDNFPLTRADAATKPDIIPDGSFCVYDEAADIAYRADTLSILNKNLIKFMNKSGKKCLLTVLVLPDLYQLDTKILNMAHMMVVVPYRFEKICSFAFLFGKSYNPLVTDKFGLERIKRLFASKKTPASVHFAAMEGKMKIKENNKFVNVPYPRQLFRFFMRLPNFVHYHRFNAVNKRFEEAYIKNVKDKQLMAHEFADQYIKKVVHNRLKKRYETLLYNLHEKGEMTYTQIANYHRDENDNFLVSKESVSGTVQKVGMRFE